MYVLTHSHFCLNIPAGMYVKLSLFARIQRHLSKNSHLTHSHFFLDKSWLVLDKDANVRPGDSITYTINIESTSGDIYSETNTGKRDFVSYDL